MQVVCAAHYRILSFLVEVSCVQRISKETDRISHGYPGVCVRLPRLAVPVWNAFYLLSHERLGSVVIMLM